jgi:hypothetical protein
MKKRISVFSVLAALLCAFTLVFAACGEKSDNSLADAKKALVATITTEYDKYDADDYKTADYAEITRLYTEAKAEIEAMKDKASVTAFDKQALFAAMAAVPDAAARDKAAAEAEFIDAAEAVTPSLTAESALVSALALYNDLSDASKTVTAVVAAKASLDGKFAAVFKLIVNAIGDVEAADDATDALIKAAEDFYAEFEDIIASLDGVSDDYSKVTAARQAFTVIESSEAFVGAIADIPADFTDRPAMLSVLTNAYAYYNGFKNDAVAVANLADEIEILFNAIGGYVKEVDGLLDAAIVSEDMAVIAPLYNELDSFANSFESALELFAPEGEFESLDDGYYAVYEGIGSVFDSIQALATAEFYSLTDSAESAFTGDAIGAAEDYLDDYESFIDASDAGYEEKAELLTELRDEFTRAGDFTAFMNDAENDFTTVGVLDGALALLGDLEDWKYAPALDAGFQNASVKFMDAVAGYFTGLVDLIDNADNDAVLASAEEIEAAKAFYESGAYKVIIASAVETEGDASGPIALAVAKYEAAEAKLAFLNTVDGLSEAVAEIDGWGAVTAKDAEYEAALDTAVKEYEKINYDGLSAEDKLTMDGFLAEINTAADGYFSLLVGLLETDIGDVDTFNPDWETYESDTELQGLYEDVSSALSLLEDYLTVAVDGEKSKYETVKGVIDALIGESNVRIEAVINEISDIDAAIEAGITSDIFAEVYAARGLFNLLTEGEQAKVNNAAALDSAENAIKQYVISLIDNLGVTIENAVSKAEAVAAAKAALNAYTAAGYPESDITNAGDIALAEEKTAAAQFIAMADEIIPASGITYEYFTDGETDTAALKNSIAALKEQFEGVNVTLLVGDYAAYATVVAGLEAAVALREAQVTAMDLIDALAVKYPETNYSGDNLTNLQNAISGEREEILEKTSADQLAGYSAAALEETLKGIPSDSSPFPEELVGHENFQFSNIVNSPNIGDNILWMTTAANYQKFFGILEDGEGNRIIDHLLIKVYFSAFNTSTLEYDDPVAVEGADTKLIWVSKRWSEAGNHTLHGVDTPHEPGDIVVNNDGWDRGWLAYGKGDVSIDPYTGAVSNGNRCYGEDIFHNYARFAVAPFMNYALGAGYLDQGENKYGKYSLACQLVPVTGYAAGPVSNLTAGTNSAIFGGTEHPDITEAKEFITAADSINLDSIAYDQATLNLIVAAESIELSAAQTGYVTQARVDKVAQAREAFDTLRASAINGFLNKVAAFGDYANDEAAILAAITDGTAAADKAKADEAQAAYNLLLTPARNETDVVAANTFLNKVIGKLFELSGMTQDMIDFISAVNNLPLVIDLSSGAAIQNAIDKWAAVGVDAEDETAFGELPDEVKAAYVTFTDAEAVYADAVEMSKTALKALQKPVLNADGSVTGITDVTWTRYQNDVKAVILAQTGAEITNHIINRQISYVYRFYDTAHELIGEVTKPGSRTLNDDNLHYHAANSQVTAAEATSVLSEYVTDADGFYYYVTFQIVVVESYNAGDTPVLSDYIRASAEISSIVGSYGDVSAVTLDMLAPEPGVFYFEAAAGGNIAYNRNQTNGDAYTINKENVDYYEMYIFLGGDFSKPEKAAYVLRIKGTQPGSTQPGNITAGRDFKFQTSDGTDIAGATFGGTWTGSNDFITKVLNKPEVFNGGYTNQTLSFGFKAISSDPSIQNSPYFVGNMNPTWN